ncbi:Citrate synthase (si) [Lachnospiraceae bacterium TWA4]|nr:Citrate synthase (si) [Lachnospiraceae bacterium TWA4]
MTNRRILNEDGYWENAQDALDYRGAYSTITDEILDLSKKCSSNDYISPDLYTEYEVKQGLRDVNGQGVRAGLTEIGDVHASDMVDGKVVPCEGQLFYRGYEVQDLVKGFPKNSCTGYEEVTYLLLFGELPNKEQMDNFVNLLASYRSLPNKFTRDVIMKAPGKDLMNGLARSVLMLYSYDDNADDISIPNVLRQSLQMIARFPLLAVYSYQAYRHYHLNKSLIIKQPREDYSTAENILWLLRPDGEFTPLEAKILDIALVLHAEHGGGNNSTFTTHVVTSSGTDTYSSTVASLGSLKGPRHGGANIKVTQMFEDLEAHVKNWEDEEEIKEYLNALLEKRAFDKKGLIYGMGHAVYSISDPRAKVFKEFVKSLSIEKGMEDRFNLFDRVERLSAELICNKRRIYKGVSANVDFYSGFVYQMLGLPMELFTPIFAIARIAGWSAHRIEELVNDGKIIRPAYKNVMPRRDYVDWKNRK